MRCLKEAWIESPPVSVLSLASLKRSYWFALASRHQPRAVQRRQLEVLRVPSRGAVSRWKLTASASGGPSSVSSVSRNVPLPDAKAEEIKSASSRVARSSCSPRPIAARPPPPRHHLREPLCPRRGVRIRRIVRPGAVSEPLPGRMRQQLARAQVNYPVRTVEQIRLGVKDGGGHVDLAL